MIVGSYNGEIWNSPDHFVMQSQGQAARLYSAIASIGSFKSTLSYVQNWQSRIFYNNGQNWLFFFENTFCCWSCFLRSNFLNWDFPLFWNKSVPNKQGFFEVGEDRSAATRQNHWSHDLIVDWSAVFLRLAVAMPELGWSATWMKFCVTGQ